VEELEVRVRRGEPDLGGGGALQRVLREASAFGLRVQGLEVQSSGLSVGPHPGEHA
jgi:hypothetical protein